MQNIKCEGGERWRGGGGEENALALSLYLLRLQFRFFFTLLLLLLIMLGVWTTVVLVLVIFCFHVFLTTNMGTRALIYTRRNSYLYKVNSDRAAYVIRHVEFHSDIGGSFCRVWGVCFCLRNAS